MNEHIDYKKVEEIARTIARRDFRVTISRYVTHDSPFIITVGESHWQRHLMVGRIEGDIIDNAQLGILAPSECEQSTQEACGFLPPHVTGYVTLKDLLGSTGSDHEHMKQILTKDLPELSKKRKGEIALALMEARFMTAQIRPADFKREMNSWLNHPALLRASVTVSEFKNLMTEIMSRVFGEMLGAKSASVTLSDE